jgi:hypothetical protein
VSEKIGFKTTDNEDAPFLESVYFFDKYCSRKVLPHELDAFFEFKENLQHMMDNGAERGFLDLVHDAKELEKTFKRCIKIFKINPLRR